MTWACRAPPSSCPSLQLGCVAGAAAIARAYDFSRQGPDRHVLLVSLEFSSLCYQPQDAQLQSFVAGALFGDAVSACVLRADDGAKGFRVEATGSFFLPDSEHYIRYEVLDTGFHFRLDKAVMKAISAVAPEMERLSREHFDQVCARCDFSYSTRAAAGYSTNWWPI